MRFLRQRVMWQFILDFYCPAHLIGIEVDGSIHELPEVHLHDLAKETGLLEEKGITIIRFTNAEILGGTQTQWYTRILAEVKSK